MSTSTPPGDEAPAKRRSPWPWITLGVAALAVGLLVWALILRSDRDDAQQQAQTSAGAAAQLKQANDELGEQLGLTSDSLDAAHQDVADSEQARQDAEAQADAAAQQVADAEKEADAAKQSAAEAQDDGDRAAAQADQAASEAAAAQAQADEAQANADAADARSSVVADCAKAYASALGGILGADDRKAALDEAKAKIADVTDACQSALSEH